MLLVEAQFNKIFKEANESRARYKVMLGSAGSGKSWNVAQFLILKLSQKQFTGCSLLVVRGVEVSHSNSTYAELCGAIDRLGLSAIWERRVSPLSLRCTATGNSVIFRGCNDVKALERLKSVTVPNGKITDVWVEESTELLQSQFDIIDDRLRGDLPEGMFYQITLTFNPIHARHWIKSTLWDYDSPDIFKHKSTYLDNRFIDTAYKQRMLRRKELDPEGYAVYGMACWGTTSGIIFPNISIGEYRQLEFEQYTIGTDFGFNHNHATLLIGWKDGEPYILREVVVQGKTTGEIIDLCEAEEIPKNVLMYCDSASPDQIKEFKQRGFRAYPVSKEVNSINNQIAWLKNRRIYIDGRCQKTQKELQSYTWQKDPTTGEYTDEPIKVNDDCVAALRYGIEPVRKALGLKTVKKGDFGIW